MVKVVRGVPLPANVVKKAGKLKNLPRGRRPTYPFEDMKRIGDSFYIDANPRTVAAAACMNAKKTGNKYITKAEGDGVRCWLLAKPKKKSAKKK